MTETIFKKFKTAKDFANADLQTLEKNVSSINFYRNKARNIQNAARIIIEKFDVEMHADDGRSHESAGRSEKNGEYRSLRCLRYRRRRRRMIQV